MSNDNNKTFERCIPISKLCSIAVSFLQEISNTDDDDNSDSRNSLYDVIEKLANQVTVSGTSDDFHNFAVELARYDEYMLACEVLEIGLKYYGGNVDLLSDFISFGTKCNRLDKCKLYYDRLKMIPKEIWTWRGFTFSIDYFIHLVENDISYCETNDINKLKEEMMEIAKHYREYFPTDENAFVSEADIYSCFNMHEEELSILEKALDELTISPKCALRCADILFSQGRYDDAIEKINRGIKDAIQTQTSINEGYVYYLAGLCKTSFILREIPNIVEDKIIEMYSDFDIALKEFGDNKVYLPIIKSKTNMIKSRTNIEIPSEFEELICLLD